MQRAAARFSDESRAAACGRFAAVKVPLPPKSLKSAFTAISYETAVLKRAGMPQERAFRARRYSGASRFSDDKYLLVGPLVHRRIPLMPLLRQVLRGTL